MANPGPDFLGATNTAINVGSQDAISEEEKALQLELESCKASLEEARKAVADTDFYEMESNSRYGNIYGDTWPRLRAFSGDGKLIVWDTFTSKKIHMIPLKTAWVMGCAFSPSLNFVASGGLDNIISLFCLKSVNNVAKHVRDLTGHSGYVGCLRFMDDQHLLSSSGDKTCAYWDVETASIISSYRGHANDVTAIAVSKQTPNTFVSSSSDHTCRLWDLRSSEAVQYFEGHQQDVNGVDFFPANAYAFASSSDDGSCRLWDIRGDQAIGVYIDDFINCGCSSVAISKSGRLLISGYDDFNCHVWDLLREERVGILSAHENRVCSVTISESGIGVATGSWDTTCLIWTAK
ncbi:hypothetical protein EG68_06940 [Paragonimus skrjabini miyazakii]|uniref:Uncharacterized protein n=1 Tax=Paragonimus skrjabini miyazakii TaxID=59628 RepID=A0A8S9YS94_9TREM|nr:hypothetical protein EG68_06940 [Paragonimus skrjabini miyazakii]